MKLTKKNILTHLAKVDGWLRDDEALLLYDLATKSKGAIVEIGSWRGKSTICLASATRNVVYAIDPHTGSLEHRQKGKKVDTFIGFKKNITNANLRNVHPLRTTSHQASKNFNKPISLLFIDGDHSYKAVKQDFQDWEPKLVDGGTIAFHDTISWPGPRRLVLESIYRSNHFKNIRLLGSITYAEKTSSLSPAEKLKNYYTLFIRHLRNLFITIPTPEPVRSLAKKILQSIQ